MRRDSSDPQGTSWRIDAALQWAVTQLGDPHHSAMVDAQLLLAHLLERDRSYLLAWPERLIAPVHWDDYQRLVMRRCDGEPIAYLLGYRHFWRQKLRVTPATLIPRPETELLVETALQLIAERGLRLLDLGTGSGAIAIAIASDAPRCEVVGVESSRAALEVAEANRREYGLRNLTLVEGSWFEPLVGQRFDIILANPPYIGAGDRHLAEGDLRFEPPSALHSGEDGLDALRHIISHAQGHLNEAGWLLLEHGYDQGVVVSELLQGAGYAELDSRVDLQGHPRLAIAKKA